MSAINTFYTDPDRTIERLRRELAAERDEVALKSACIAGLQAARMAYASEFPLDAEGEPNVGSIHENIRKMKAELTEVTAERDRLRDAIWGAPHWEYCGDRFERECDCWKRSALGD